MIEAVIVALAALGALFWILGPLARPRVDRDDPGRAEEANAKKHAALASILDLEMERDTGKLSDEDFDVLRHQAEAEALAALAEADLVASATTDDDELEREIAEMREKLACPSCGAVRAPGKPCARCGADA